jgi:hypothetical protein
MVGSAIVAAATTLTASAFSPARLSAGLSAPASPRVSVKMQMMPEFGEPMGFDGPRGPYEREMMREPFMRGPEGPECMPGEDCMPPPPMNREPFMRNRDPYMRNRNPYMRNRDPYESGGRGRGYYGENTPTGNYGQSPGQRPERQGFRRGNYGDSFAATTTANDPNRRSFTFNSDSSVGRASRPTQVANDPADFRTGQGRTAPTRTAGYQNGPAGNQNGPAAYQNGPARPAGPAGPPGYPGDRQRTDFRASAPRPTGPPPTPSGDFIPDWNALRDQACSELVPAPSEEEVLRLGKALLKQEMAKIDVVDESTDLNALRQFKLEQAHAQLAKAPTNPMLTAAMEEAEVAMQTLAAEMNKAYM